MFSVRAKAVKDKCEGLNLLGMEKSLSYCGKSINSDGEYILFLNVGKNTRCCSSFPER